MSSFARVLAGILVALLPLQGIAAASMSVCIADAASPGAHAAHGDDAHDGHDHGGGHESVPAHEHGDEEHGASECCVAPGAPAPASPCTDSPRSGVIAAPFHGAAQHSVVPAGLERPPRISSL